MMTDQNSNPGAEENTAAEHPQNESGMRILMNWVILGLGTVAVGGGGALLADLMGAAP
jgi:hypothetical protein